MNRANDDLAQASDVKPKAVEHSRPGASAGGGRLTVTATLDSNLASEGTVIATVVTADTPATAYQGQPEFWEESSAWKFWVHDHLGSNDTIPSGTKIEAVYKGDAQFGTSAAGGDPEDGKKQSYGLLATSCL